MATRTVRLDAAAERALREIRTATGLQVSDALKRGLHALRAELDRGTDRMAFDIYRELDLGPGGHARSTSSDVKRTVRETLRRKTGR